MTRRFQWIVAGGAVATAIVALGVRYGTGAHAGANHHPAVIRNSDIAKSRSSPPDVAVPRDLWSSGEAISLARGMLSVNVHEQRLGPMLVQIAHRSGVPIFTAPEIDRRIVSAKFDGLPLEQGLRQLLEGCDTFFYISSGGTDRGALRGVWAYPPGDGRELIPVPPASWASAQEFERKLASAEPAERILALETIVARDGPASLETVMRGIADTDAEVRLRALDVALSANVPLPSEVVAGLTGDVSADVRALALEAIVNATEPGSAQAPETDALLRRMQGDPSAQVRARVGELLETARVSEPKPRG